MKRIFVIIICIVISIFVCISCLSLDDIMAFVQRNVIYIRNDIHNYFFIGCIAYVVIAIVLYNLPIPFTAFLKTMSGLVFGWEWGMLLNIISSGISAMMGCFIVRNIFFKRASFLHNTRLLGVHKEIELNGFWYIVSSRLFMGVPFFLVNVAAGLSTFPIRKFGVATAIGVIPVSWLYAEAGSQLRVVKSLTDLASPSCIVLLSVMAVLSFLVPFLNSRHPRKLWFLSLMRKRKT